MPYRSANFVLDLELRQMAMGREQRARLRATACLGGRYEVDRAVGGSGPLASHFAMNALSRCGYGTSVDTCADSRPGAILTARSMIIPPAENSSRYLARAVAQHHTD